MKDLNKAEGRSLISYQLAIGGSLAKSSNSAVHDDDFDPDIDPLAVPKNGEIRVPSLDEIVVRCHGDQTGWTRDPRP